MDVPFVNQALRLCYLGNYVKNFDDEPPPAATATDPMLTTYLGPYIRWLKAVS